MAGGVCVFLVRYAYIAISSEQEGQIDFVVVFLVMAFSCRRCRHRRFYRELQQYCGDVSLTFRDSHPIDGRCSTSRLCLFCRTVGPTLSSASCCGTHPFQKKYRQHRDTERGGTMQRPSGRPGSTGGVEAKFTDSFWYAFMCRSILLVLLQQSMHANPLSSSYQFRSRSTSSLPDVV